jgi:hypothetical protein
VANLVVGGAQKYHTARMFRISYTDPGVYVGQRLGTPCDDLL